MDIPTNEDLNEASRSIASILAKCEKVILKLKPGTSSHTLTMRRIAAFKIALTLIEQELQEKGVNNFN